MTAFSGNGLFASDSHLYTVPPVQVIQSSKWNFIKSERRSAECFKFKLRCELFVYSQKPHILKDVCVKFSVNVLASSHIIISHMIMYVSQRL